MEVETAHRVRLRRHRADLGPARSPYSQDQFAVDDNISLASPFVCFYEPSGEPQPADATKFACSAGIRPRRRIAERDRFANRGTEICEPGFDHAAVLHRGGGERERKAAAAVPAIGGGAI